MALFTVALFTVAASRGGGEPNPAVQQMAVAAASMEIRFFP
ncbi:MAG: hypothetical protein ACKO2F_08285 [Cyanobacteriota bacterium]